MFWGLILKANKKYSQTVTKSFHVSCAALDQSTVQTNEDIQVMLVVDDNAFLLCTLRKGSICQVPLDLNFAEGDKISFSTKGNGIVHLTGYLIPQDEFGMDDSDGEEEATPEDLKNLKKLMEGAGEKLGKADKKKKAKEATAAADSDEDDEDGDEEADAEEGSDDGDLQFEDSDGDDDSDDDEEEEEDDDEDESDDEVEEPKPKVQKLDKKDKKQNGTANGTEKPKQEGKKDKKATQEVPAAEKGQKRTLAGGVIVEELRVGTGLEAKNGKKVQVYYEGRLKTNNKVFDSTKNGPGFKFALGRGDVIKAWDLGVAGMKVGGKRRLTCPPAVAYGAKGSPPVIPPNSTLVFDVELKNVL